MYRDQLHFKRRPFQETIDTAFFFSGGKRRDILGEITHSLRQAIPLLVVTGPEGIGKTMLCRMVEKELPAGLTSVYLPRSIESFDDMLKIVAAELGVGPPGGELPTATHQVLPEIVEVLKAGGQRLVIFFDEAEKIYLATLERIRKLLDQVNVDDTYVQILLAGRALLTDNLEQLKIVAFEPVEERRFTLEPLAQEAVWAYLNDSINVASGEKIEAFDQQTAFQIGQASGGVFRKINSLANDFLQAGELEPSFMGLLDTIDQKPAVSKEQTAPTRRSPQRQRSVGASRDLQAALSALPAWLIYGGSGVVILILLVLVMNRSGSHSETSVTDPPSQDQSLIAYQQAEQPKPDATETALSASTENQPLNNQNDAAPVAAPSPIEPPTLGDAQQDGKAADAASAVRPAEIVIEPPPGPPDAEVAAVDLSPPVPAAIPVETTPEIAIIADSQKKVFTSRVPLSQQFGVQREGVSSRGVESLYRARLAAGARWLVGDAADKFTLQLMVLTAEQAEDNLKDMLRSKDYRDIADQLYILRSVGNITTIMVFYGEYPTLASARSARNSLPIYLRKHNPYAIAVQGAVEKATTAQ